MNDLHRLLIAAADGLAEPLTPPFERVLARAHRRTVLAATSVTTAALAVSAAAVVPIFLSGHFQSTPRPVGVSGSLSPPSAPAKPAAFGTLSGRALLYGGPVTGGSEALNGMPDPGMPVKVVQNGTQVTSMVTGADGTFNFQLPPGTYTIEGCGQDSVDVRANNTTTHDLICPVK